MNYNAIKLKISGMTCGHCAQHVTDELKEIQGIDRVSVILNAGGVSTVDMFISKEIQLEEAEVELRTQKDSRYGKVLVHIS